RSVVARERDYREPRLIRGRVSSVGAEVDRRDNRAEATRVISLRYGNMSKRPSEQFSVRVLSSRRVMPYSSAERERHPSFVRCYGWWGLFSAPRRWRLARLQRVQAA